MTDRPDTLHPKLVSAGYPDYVQRVTPHTFVRRERVEIDTGPEPRFGIALIYSCDVTGFERRWGLE